MKRRKKTPRQKANDKVWEHCKRITRSRFDNVCYTCNAQGLEGCNWQTGHGKPKGALSLKYQYDLRNLRPQCMKCNIHLGGASDIFIANLEREEEGLEFLVDACVKMDGKWEIEHQPPMGGKDALIFLEGLIEEYKMM